MNAIPVTNLFNKPCYSQFDDQDWDILAHHWYPVARIQDVSTQPQQVTLLDVKLALYKTQSGAIQLVRDLCPHRGVPLTKGWVSGENIVCPYHGLHYNAEGQCIKIPAQPELTKISERFSLTKFPVVEKYGLIWTSIFSRDESKANFPELETWDTAGQQSILPPFVDIGGSSGRQLEGFIDVAHFAWVHQGSFADRENQVVPKYSTERTDYGLHTEYLSDVSNYPHGMQHLAPEGFLWKRVFDVYPPFSAVLTVHFPEQGLLKILNACCPVSHNKTRLFVPLTRNFDTTGDLQAVYDFNAQILRKIRTWWKVKNPKSYHLIFPWKRILKQIAPQPPTVGY